MKRAKVKRWTGVTVSKIDWINGQVVTFLGWAGGYPWVRPVDGGKPFVWSEEDLRRLRCDEGQMALPLVAP